MRLRGGDMVGGKGLLDSRGRLQGGGLVDECRGEQWSTPDRLQGGGLVDAWWAQSSTPGRLQGGALVHAWLILLAAT